jgi:hypothetical protein
LHIKLKGELHPGRKLTSPKKKKNKNSGLLHNKPKAELHPGHKLTSPEEEDKEELWPVSQ